MTVQELFHPTTPGDYPEDFAGENGNYENRCCSCREIFYGHKRRLVCKRCNVEEKRKKGAKAHKCNAKAEGGEGMMTVKPSPTADTRTCDYTSVSVDTLIESSKQHIRDVSVAMSYFSDELLKAARQHDTDKITGIKQFHDDFITGFKTTGWWDNHRKISRHHLLSADGVPSDVNLIDVMEMIADCVMAGMARSGSVYPVNISPELLLMAFQNTVAKLKAQITLEAPR